MVAVIGLDDGIGLDDVFWVVGGLAVTFGFLTAVLRPVWKRLCAFLDWQEKFQRDWDGEAEEPGRDRVPGVMERLNAIDGELKRNGGASLKDQVVAISERVQLIEARQQSIATHLEVHARTLDEHVRRGSRALDSGSELL